MKNKFKVGDRVRIINWKDGQRPKTWNNEGRMDCWRGRVVTIIESSSGSYSIKEDQNSMDRQFGWNWYEPDFESIEYLEDDLFSL